MRTLFVASLLANVIALYALVTKLAVPADRNDDSVQEMISLEGGSSRDVADATTYFKELRDKGLAIGETKPLVLAWLVEHSAHGDNGEDSYWEGSRPA